VSTVNHFIADVFPVSLHIFMQLLEFVREIGLQWQFEEDELRRLAFGNLLA
jgi:hypothetical protein